MSLQGWPWELPFYIFKTFPLEAGWEASFNIRHITEPLDGRTGYDFYFIDRIRLINTQGSLVADLTITAFSPKIDLPNLVPGVYTLWATCRDDAYPDLCKIIFIQPG